MMAALRFRSGEIILDCFQKGRMSQWARAHFFVGRENGVCVGVTVGAGWRWRAGIESELKIRALSRPVEPNATGKDS
jgi:hypothetical protein